MDYINNHTNEEITQFYNEHSKMVYRVCFSYLKNPTDSADMVQETFLKWIICKNPPKNKTHEIAWLATVAGNLCKNYIKKNKRNKNFELIEQDIPIDFEEDKNSYITEAVLSLPEKYKTVVYLFYYEELSIAEIAKATKKKQSTILSQLHRARKILKTTLGDDEYV